MKLLTNKIKEYDYSWGKKMKSMVSRKQDSQGTPMPNEKPILLVLFVAERPHKIKIQKRKP